MSTVKTERLLIADDEPNLLTAYVLFFGAYGFTSGRRRRWSGNRRGVGGGRRSAASDGFSHRL
jgi:hypothetical protein